MEIFPIGFAVFAIFLLAQTRSMFAALCVAMAILPFNVLAVLSVGNFNFLVVHLAFLTLFSVMIGRHLLSPNAHLIPRFEKSGVILLALTVYALITAQVFPRLFAGDIWVFSLDQGASGQRVSTLFLSQISLLRPSSGNISQPVYFALSTAVFFMALRLARTRGLKSLDIPLFIAAGASAITGFLDFVGLDNILSLFKTAGYVIFLDTRIAGASRIVGGFSEASGMGTFCAAMSAYMLMRYLESGNRWALVLAGINLLWTALALSSTGYVALGAAGLFIFWKTGLRRLTPRIKISAMSRFAFVALIVVCSALLLSLLTDADDVVWTFLDELIFQKGTSISALERGAWARRGMAIGMETYGLGAGLGSTFSNGLFAVCFSNVGVPGMSLYVYFIWSLFKVSPSQRQSGINTAYYNAATVALLTSLAAKLVSTTSANLGILFMVFAAMAVASRPAQYYNIKGQTIQNPGHA